MSVPIGGIYNGDVGIPGERCEIKAAERITSGRAAEGSIPFGTLVVMGNTASQVKVPTAGTDKPLGIARRHDGASDVENDSYLETDQVDIVENGVFSVLVEDAVNPNSVVHVRIAGSGTYGSLRSSGVAGETATVSGARFKSTTTGSGRAALDILGELTFTAD